MFEIKLLNVLTNQVFTKTFGSYYLWQKSLHKIKYSKKLKILSYGKVY